LVCGNHLCFSFKYDIILLQICIIAIILTLAQPIIAAMAAYFDIFISGELAPFWPHAGLLSVSVLASFAVGIGILLERPQYASLHKTAFWLVIGGIAVEALCTILLFAFDEGISSAQQSKIGQLASDNNTLERVMVSRRFFPGTSVFMRNFLIRLHGYRGFRVLIAVVPDIEAKQFAEDIYSSLKATFGMDPEYVPVSDPPDVAEGIFISVGSSVSSHAAGVRLASIFNTLGFGDIKEKVAPDIGSLTTVGIPVSTQWTPPPNSPPNIVRIDIGARPFTETMLKLWHAPYPEMLPTPENGPAVAK
jgi:hypothetical protein